MLNSLNNSMFFIIVVSLVLTLHQVNVQAVINLPNYGNRTYVRKGSDVVIPWTYTDNESNVLLKKWYFSNSSTSRATDFKQLSFLLFGGNFTIVKLASFTNIEGEKPATLIVKNVNLNHGGTYRLELFVGSGKDPPPSDVLVIITEQPTAVINCSQTIKVNEGEDVTCLCDSKGGRPPPNATFSKDDEKQLTAGYMRTTLSLKNISRDDAGKYKCRVVSHDLSDESVMKLVLNSAPTDNGTKFPVGGETVAVLGEKFIITCEFEGCPEARYKLFHNGTKLTDDVTGGKYSMCSVKDTDAGEYICEAGNSLGKINKTFTLIVKERPIKSEVTTKPTRTGGKGSSSVITEWYIVIVASVSGIVIGMVLTCAILFLRRSGNKSKRDLSQRRRNDASNDDENISVYQELDLAKRHAEDNYQSLRMTCRNPRNNGEKDENEAGYAELNEVRGNHDDDYQSLNLEYINAI